MVQGDNYAVFTTADDAFTVDDTALWLARLDGLYANSIEDLTAVNQEMYREKANSLHQYLGQPDESAKEALIRQWRGDS